MVASRAELTVERSVETRVVPSVLRWAGLMAELTVIQKVENSADSSAEKKVERSAVLMVESLAVTMVYSTAENWAARWAAPRVVPRAVMLAVWWVDTKVSRRADCLAGLKAVPKVVR